MSKRRAAVEQTKGRIIDATMALHAEKGVLVTSWEDIAERSGVAVGTVYRHFPTLDELVPACGAVSMARLALPSPGEIDELYAGARSRRERLRRLTGAVFDLYDRGEDVFVAVRRDHDALEPLSEAHAQMEAALSGLVAAALAPGGDDLERRAARALIDFDTWRALRAQGIEGEQARDLIAGLLAG